MWVVKAQIHAGGRGKGGGVKIAKSIDEVKQHASQILGMQLKTPQTGPAGTKSAAAFDRGRRRHQARNSMSAWWSIAATQRVC